VALQYGASSPAAVVIAEHLAAGFQQRGFVAEVRTFRDAAALNLSRFAGAVLIVPVPLDRDEKDFLEFVRTQKEMLERVPVAFISMSAAQSREAREGTTQDDEARAKSAQLVDDTRASLDRLFAQTGWRPQRQWPIAGSITYMRYNFVVRLILKLLATGPVKPSGRLDDWKALNDFLDEFEREIRVNPS
jgi:menaquinone-dependent protoporphyrinogen oxidase